MSCRPRRRFFGALLIAAASACSAADDIPAPAIASLFPTHGPPGTTITIEGSHLCQQPEDEESDPLRCDHEGDVVVASTPALVSEYLDTRIVAVIPELAPGPAGVVVRVVGRSTRDVTFVVDPPASAASPNGR